MGGKDTKSGTSEQSLGELISSQLSSMFQLTFSSADD